MGRKKQNRFCPRCGEPVEINDNFCANCGRKITAKKHRRRDQPAGKGKNWKLITVITVGVLIIGGVIFSGVKRKKERKIYAAHNTGQIVSIVSQFDCSCGRCDKTLAECDCPTAKDTQAYIRELVNQGKYSRKEILQMVNKKYGYYKGKEPLIKNSS